MSAEKYLGEWRTTRWERGFAALRKFRAREGHCCPSRYHVEGNFKLGDWVSLQRYRKDLLPTERKRRLDAIRFVLGLQKLRQCYSLKSPSWHCGLLADFFCGLASSVQ